MTGKDMDALLKEVQSGDIKGTIESGSPLFDGIEWLIEKEYIEAIVVSYKGCDGFMDPKLTISGKEWLRESQKIELDVTKTGDAKKWTKSDKQWFAGIVVAILAIVIPVVVEMSTP